MASQTLQEVNLLDLLAFEKGVPHHWFKVLRQEAPVYWHPDPETGDGFWVLTKYHDLVQVSMDTQTFSSAQGITLATLEFFPSQNLMMITTDPPRHTRLRRLVSHGFTPKMISLLEPDVRRMAGQLLDHAIEKGECDFVTAVAAELPLMVIARFLGVPQEDRHQIFRWSNQILGAGDPEYGGIDLQRPPETEEERQALIEHFRQVVAGAAMEMAAYLQRLEEERLRAPKDDLVSIYLHAQVDGEKLSMLERHAQFVLLAVAGNETTRNAISGGLLALLQHPDQLELLRQDPSLIPMAVEEILRYVSPVMYMRRTATKDAEIHGVTIKAGQRVTMWYVSANRDEEVFPEPDRFDVTRQPNDHVAFGAGGPHFCLGANLARLEIRVLLEELLARPYEVEVAGPVQRLRSNFINGIKHMPVRFRRRKVA
jgi:cholest-4-en-3-one 26-monooxygenase